LSDPDKRADYDRFGDAGPAQATQRAQRRHQEEDISPEEIFNMFFGGGFRPRRAQQPRQRQQAHAEHRGGMSQFVQFLPLLFIFLLSLLSIPSAPDVPFR
jgi:DnaJ-class molecular chaperone